MDMYGFYTGTELYAYEWLGAHYSEAGTMFRTFAPGADGVVLVLDNAQIPMNRAYNGQFYEVYVPGISDGTAYEYRVYHHGTYTDHCDPYGFGMELRPAHRSIVRDLGRYSFHDNSWMKKRGYSVDKPLNIYELHAGSWKKNGEDWYTYDELAPLLIPYLKENGYTHVEFLPLNEHPCDESWGYQATGFFAPTSRYGTAQQLMALIDELHKNKIGAILDFVPTHFALDDYSLGLYDGTRLYENPSMDVGVSEWGSYNFLHSRGEVRSFLLSCAHYWMKEYHFDGLRMDAIRNILYWQGNEARGTNPNGIVFLQSMNRELKKVHPGCLLIAEDSSNYPGVTKSPDEGGLGFDYKWDLGWMHDTLDYFRTPPAERPANYHKLTFSMMYFPNERYLLPYSHDEVVHGKATILQKMYGDYEGKFPQGRAMYMYMMVHPGKKLNFMGNEFGQLREWDEKREQDWLLFDYPLHDSFAAYMRELNKCYLENTALYEDDYSGNGFGWLDCHQEARSIYAISRSCYTERLAAIFNFSDQTQNYQIDLPDTKSVKLLLHSNWERFGGNVSENDIVFKFENGRLFCELAPYTGMLFKQK